jgi:bacteriorhodopsin
MGNSAVRINGFTNTVTTNNHITDRGSDWYFTVCAVMGACTLGVSNYPLVHDQFSTRILSTTGTLLMCWDMF